ncbi:MAG: chemotaxis protein CheX [Magnetococcales bacterium]|nr:chemotaxis protein CheX [Magnetococcales bacterium]
MNEEMADAILESVLDICRGYLSLEICSGIRHEEVSLEILEALEGLSVSQETTTVVSFTGALRGAVVLRGSVSIALLLVSALAGKRFDSLAGQAVEVLGELADLIAGGIRTRLSAHGEIRLTPPLVVIGSRYALYNARIFSRARQFFQVEEGTFFVECYYLKDSA